MRHASSSPPRAPLRPCVPASLQLPSLDGLSVGDMVSNLVTLINKTSYIMVCTPSCLSFPAARQCAVLSSKAAVRARSGLDSTGTLCGCPGTLWQVGPASLPSPRLAQAAACTPSAACKPLPRPPAPAPRPLPLQVVGSACKCLCTIAGKSEAAAPRLAELAAVYAKLVRDGAASLRDGGGGANGGMLLRFLFTLGQLCRWARAPPRALHGRSAALALSAPGCSAAVILLAWAYRGLVGTANSPACTPAMWKQVKIRGQLLANGL